MKRGKKDKTGGKKEAPKKKRARIRGMHEYNINEQQIFIRLSHFEYSRLDQLFQGREARRYMCVYVCDACIQAFPSLRQLYAYQTHRVQRPRHRASTLVKHGEV
jgi:hypothetical protein